MIPETVKHLTLTDYYSIFRKKLNLRRSDKYVALLNLSIYYTWKNKKLCKNNKFKISAPTCNEEFKLPGEHILYQIFKIILSIS